MSISYPYAVKRIEEGLLVDPRIVMEIKTRFGFIRVKFLVDSGADVTTLPLSPYAILFEFQKNPARKTTIGGVEGGRVIAHPHELTMRLGKDEMRIRCYLIESRVDPLLGRLDFWSRYSINFDNKLKATFLTKL